MQAKNKRDVIVIGAGISGLAVASQLAKANFDVLVIDRRQSVNAKTNMSGLIELELIEEIFGKIQANSTENPLQRKIVEKRAHCLQDNDSTLVNYKPTENEKQIFSVLKRDLCKYLVQSCENKGAQFLFNHVAREFLVEDKKVIGIKTDNEEILADLVIVAEGPQMILAKSQGLRIGEVAPQNTFIFVEEYIELPVNKINKLFDVNGYSGIAMKFFTAFDNLKGFGYLNLNKNGFSVGVGIPLKDSIEKRVNINSYLQKFKNHKILCNYFKGDFNAAGYYSYIVPMPPVPKNAFVDTKLSVNGCLLVGGAASLMNMFDWDLSCLPLGSAKCAAQTIIASRNESGFSKEKLAGYEHEIKKNLFEAPLTNTNAYNNGQDILLNTYTNISDSGVYDDLSLYLTNRGKENVGN